MIKVKDQLMKESAKTTKELSVVDIITDTNRLLAERGQDDYEMLRSMGMHSNLQRVVELKGRKMELEAMKAKWGQIFTEAEIKAIACKYALKFRRSDTYKGNVDPTLMQKMREFSTQHEVELSATRLQYNFFLLAPPSAFTLEKRPKPVAPARMSWLDTDPLVFYKIDDKHYTLIHQWGEDLTNWRRILGWKYTSQFNYAFWWFVSLFVPAFALAQFISPSPWWLFLAIPAFITSVAMTPEKSAELEWGHTWNDEFKPKV